MLWMARVFATNSEISPNVNAANANRVRRMVYFSTVDVFGVQKDSLITDESPLQYSGFHYSDTKLRAEELVWEYHKRHGLPVSIIRPTFVFGPGDRMFIPELLDALGSRLPVYIGGPNHSIGISYVENITKAVWLQLTQEDAVGKAFIFNDANVTWEWFVTNLIQDLDVKPPPFSLPYRLGYALAWVMQTVWKVLGLKGRPPLTTYVFSYMGNNMQYSDEHLRRVLGYKPEVSTLDAIQRTAEWVKAKEETP